MRYETLPLEYEAILKWIRQGSSVLDLGCGNGELLDLLVREKSVRAQGIEISEQAIYQCVAKGLSVFHEDIDHGLSDYADHSFDYVILNQSFQQVKSADLVLKEALRVGREVIVGFPNFAHYQARLQIFFRGKTPVTPSQPYCFDRNISHLERRDPYHGLIRRGRRRHEKSPILRTQGRTAC